MSIENLTNFVDELIEIIKFHELDTVDSRAAELIILAKSIKKEISTDKEENFKKEMDDWFEEMRIANLINTTR